jgi:uncharacterized DUF497 family protein
MRVVRTAEFTEFEWDDGKAERNIWKHGISFEDAAVALTQPHIEFPGHKGNERRTVAICGHSGRVISVVYTLREGKCRIISARAARDYEQREYRFLFDRRDS